jgi:hypothetical protein
VNPEKSDTELRVTDILDEHSLVDLVGKYYDLFPESGLGPYDSDTSKQILEFDISALPDEAGVQADFFSAPLAHTFEFAEQDQESRLRDLINDTSYQLVDDQFDRVIVVAFNFAQGDTSEEITDEVIQKEIEDFFRTITVTYDLTPSELSSAKITWNHYD